MALFFIVTLALSVLAMITMLALKRYELASGRVVLASARPGLSAFFQNILHWSQQILPALAQRQIKRTYQFILTQIQRAIAYAIITFERALEWMLSAVRERTNRAHPSQEPSAFLREVADHKKTLLYKKDLKREPPHDSVQE